MVSGLARGVDTAAHIGALGAGGRTVAVIGTGLRHSYPPANAGLQNRIAATGAVISQFTPDTPPAGPNFLARNAVMAGYTAATLVVEAPWRSGARAQARMALEQGRRVFLPVPLLVYEWARDYARRPGVIVIRDAGDAVQQLKAVTTHRRTW